MNNIKGLWQQMCHCLWILEFMFVGIFCSNQKQKCTNYNLRTNVSNEENGEKREINTFSYELRMISKVKQNQVTLTFIQKSKYIWTKQKKKQKKNRNEIF